MKGRAGQGRHRSGSTAAARAHTRGSRGRLPASPANKGRARWTHRLHGARVHPAARLSGPGFKQRRHTDVPPVFVFNLRRVGQNDAAPTQRGRRRSVVTWCVHTGWRMCEEIKARARFSTCAPSPTVSPNPRAPTAGCAARRGAADTATPRPHTAGPGLCGTARRGRHRHPPHTAGPHSAPNTTSTIASRAAGTVS